MESRDIGQTLLTEQMVNGAEKFWSGDREPEDVALDGQISILDFNYWFKVNYYHFVCVELTNYYG